MGTVKNIFVLDCSENEIFKDFLENPYFNVIGCIVFTKEQKQYCIENNIKIVYTLEEMDFLSELDHFNFSLIHKFRPTQRKIEFGMMRSLNSNMIIANKYYNALCLFEKIFQDHKIECVFVNGLPHGYIPETLLLDFGKNYNIPTYYTFPITAHYTSIMRYNDGKCLEVKTPISKLELTQDLFNKNKNSYSLDLINKRLTFSQRIVHWGGGQLLIDILSCIKRFKTNITMGFYQVPLIEKIYSFYRLRETKKFYKKNSIQPNYSKKFVFYAIHFEPEAATGVVCDLQNQLTIIQLLSSCLPKDWLLYIKDHPHQYNINNNLDHYYITNIQFFKDKKFYQEILKLKNVRLIDLKTPSQDLIKHAKVISTINGSIILESINDKKPCITFDNYLMPITQCQLFPNIFTFSSTQQLKQYFDKKKWKNTITDDQIEEGYEQLRKYYFDHYKSTSCIAATIWENIENISIN